MSVSTKAGRFLATAAVLVVTACGGGVSGAIPQGAAAAADDAGLPAEPSSSGAVREVFPVESMRSLVEQSDLVIVGRATAVVPGRKAGRDVGGQLAFRDVTVEVQRVLHGAYSSDTLTLEELGWKDGEPFTVNQAEWAEPGDMMLMGLRATPDGETGAGPRFILTSSSARFFLGRDGEVEDNYRPGEGDNEANAFVREAAGLRADDLIRRVEQAG